MQHSKLNNRHSAQLSAQHREFKSAEEKIINYIDSNPSLLNTHFAYNDLMIYTTSQFNEDIDSINRCFIYCIDHLKVISVLINDFNKYNYNFESEYIPSVYIGIKIALFQKDINKIMNICNILSSIYTDKNKLDYFANILFQVVHDGFPKEININDEIREIFQHQQNIKNKLSNCNDIETNPLEKDKTKDKIKNKKNIFNVFKKKPRI